MLDVLWPIKSSQIDKKKVNPLMATAHHGINGLGQGQGGVHAGMHAGGQPMGAWSARLFRRMFCFKWNPHDCQDPGIPGKWLHWSSMMNVIHLNFQWSVPLRKKHYSPLHSLSNRGHWQYFDKNVKNKKLIHIKKIYIEIKIIWPICWISIKYCCITLW